MSSIPTISILARISLRYLNFYFQPGKAFNPYRVFLIPFARKKRSDCYLSSNNFNHPFIRDNKSLAILFAGIAELKTLRLLTESTWSHNYLRTEGAVYVLKPMSDSDYENLLKGD